MVQGALITERASGQQHQCRTQTLATTVDDVLADLLHQTDVGMQIAVDDRIDGQHVRLDQMMKFFLLQRSILGKGNSAS